MMSAPKTMPGRRRRRRSVSATAAARECRRFMRLRMRSSPDCSERWRCGISRGSSANAASSSSSISTQSSEESRSRSSAADMAQDLPHQRAELRRAGEIGAVAREIDAGQHHLAIAVFGEPAHLRDHLAHGDGARVAAAERDDAEGAAMVAAVLDLDIGAGAPVEPLDQVRCGLRHRHDVVDDDLLLAARRRSRSAARTPPPSRTMLAR